MLQKHRQWRIVHTESEIGWGGQEHRILAELTGFQKRGCDVHLLVTPRGKLFDRAQQAGIPTHPLRVFKKEMPLSILQTFFWLRRHRVDVLNTHSSRDSWIAAVAGRLARVPLIIRTRHIDVTYPNRWLSRHAYATFADHVMTTSDKITAHFREYFRLSPERVSTIPTGIDLNRFSSNGEKAALLPTGDDSTVPIIGMVCVLRGWKGHRTFLEAAKILKESGFRARFVMVGEGSALPSVTALIEQSNLTGYAFGLGHRDDVTAVLRALSVLVIPSTANEGIPQIGLQALACRTPAVGSDVGGTPEIIKPGETGRIFPAGNAAALVGTIRETLADREATERMVEQGARDVAARHSLDAMLDQIEAIYSHYLRSHPPNEH